MEKETAFDGVANSTTVGTLLFLSMFGRPIGCTSGRPIRRDYRFLEVGHGSFPFYGNISLPLLLKDEGMSFSGVG